MEAGSRERQVKFNLTAVVIYAILVLLAVLLYQKVRGTR